ncbi:pirin [Streptomyces sp. NPDC048696]|uniref:pirin n=1 Tax=Streptomyces sp. NPDC048696 TaxID=3365585 RepID=UPI0037181574
MDLQAGWGRRPRELWSNFIGRMQADIEEAWEEWMSGARFGEVKGYDGERLSAPALPAVALKARGGR